MSEEYRYTLDFSSKKHICPRCSRKTFVRYIDREREHYLPAQYGRCDREEKCKYYCNPYTEKYGMDAEGNRKKNTKVKFEKKYGHVQTERNRVHFNGDFFVKTMIPERYAKNTFICNLIQNVKHPFNIKDVMEVVSLYQLGTCIKKNGQRCGALTIPFIDKNDNVRAVQVKEFNGTNNTIETTFLHKVMINNLKKEGKQIPEWLIEYDKQEKKVDCLFGEHLLKQYPNNPVGLVEAPKSAIYCTLYFGLPDTADDILWLAVFNKSTFKIDRIKALEGRRIFVFPDLSKDGSTYNDWKKEAQIFEREMRGTKFYISDLLENKANENQRLKGADIADILIEHDWKGFRKKNNTPTPAHELPEGKNEDEVSPACKFLDELFECSGGYSVKHERMIEKNVSYRQTAGAPINLYQDIKELEGFFEGKDLPDVIKIHDGTILNPKEYINRQLDCAKNGRPDSINYIDRLKELKEFLTV